MGFGVKMWFRVMMGLEGHDAVRVQGHDGVWGHDGVGGVMMELGGHYGVGGHDGVWVFVMGFAEKAMASHSSTLA